MKITACCLCILIPFLLSAQKKFKLHSPDGNIVFTFYNDNGKAAYAVTYKKQIVVDKSFLSLDFKDGLFANKIKASKADYFDSTEDYNLITGKTSHVHDSYKEMIIPLVCEDEKNITIQFAVKAFNDGVAFQYRFNSG